GEVDTKKALERSFFERVELRNPNRQPPVRHHLRRSRSPPQFAAETTRGEQARPRLRRSVRSRYGMSRIWCSSCSKHQESDWNDEGFIFCTGCGKVVQDNVYSNDPTFFKDAAGQTQLSGRNVKSVQSEYSASRERTLNNAYDFIWSMAENLQIQGGHQIVGPAKELYTIALERNFIRGRRADQVAAACLYISCREQKKAFLLIEFAEFLSVNVYVLGTVFLQLCKLLSLEEHPIVKKPVDPSLFIHRFAKLLLGQTEMDPQIEKTAISIMKSMKRDWMQTGRKPSGLCGAALYISALAHGHKFTKTDVVRIVHICEATLTKRLIEFEETASGSLTIEELNQHAEEFERNLKSSEYSSSFQKSEKVQLLCQHKGSEIPHFAHGLCESCHKEFVEISGGLEGGAEPPAFQHAERERMAKLQQERGPNATAGKNADSGVGRKETATGSNHNEVGADHASTEDGDGSDKFSDIDDAEVDGYLHNEEETKYKKVIWEEMNREYLEEQAAKEAAIAAAKEAEMASFHNCSEDVLAARELAAKVAANVAKSKKEKREKRAAESKTPQTAAEATHQMLKRKRLSSRVNYDVLKEIFDEPVVQDKTEKKIDDEAQEKTDDYWGTMIDDEDEYNHINNAQDQDYYNEEEVYNHDNAADDEPCYKTYNTTLTF
ncbi:hypothetical protein V2J09_010134, partial [Rumex salicifolius]